MDHIYKYINNYLHKPVQQNAVFVEIGSEREDGSTSHIADLARKYSVNFHSVDVEVEKKSKHENVIWHTEKGSVWTSQYGNTISKPISMLFLDNVDYNYNMMLDSSIEERKSFWMRQKTENAAFFNDDHTVPAEELKRFRANRVNLYASRYNINLSNEYSQVEHLTQCMNLFPYLSDNAIVVMDDTYKTNDCWIGKCGGVVLFLLSKGYNILKEDKLLKGVIMSKMTI